MDHKSFPRKWKHKTQTKGRLFAYGAEENTPKEGGRKVSSVNTWTVGQPWVLTVGWLALWLPRFEQATAFGLPLLVSLWEGLKRCSPTHNTASLEDPKVNFRIRVKKPLAINSRAASTSLWLHLRKQPKFIGPELTRSSLGLGHLLCIYSISLYILFCANYVHH